MSARDPFGRPRAGRADADADASSPPDESQATGRGEWQPQPLPGWCEQQLQSELPGLALVSIAVELPAARLLTRPSPPALVERLQELSNRFGGARAVAIRQEPVPAAYRALYRQIGLDPDATRTPIEQAVLVRVLEGGFRSRGLLADVLTLALADTAVPVWAVDAETVDGPLGIRVGARAEQPPEGAYGTPLADRLLVADAREPVAILFAEPFAAHRPGRSTSRLLLYAVQAPGVPTPHVQEALYSARAALLEACRTR